MKDLNDRWEDEVYSIAAERREPVHVTARRQLNRLVRRVANLEAAAQSALIKRRAADAQKHFRDIKNEPDDD